MQQHLLLKLLDHNLTLSLVGFLQVAGDVVDTTAIGDGHHDTLVHMTLLLVNTLDDGPCYLADMLSLAVEVGQCSLEGFLSQFLWLLVGELLFGEGHLHSEEMQEFLLAAFVVVALNNRRHTVPDGVGDIHADTLTHQGVTTLLVDNRTLFVHHVIIFQQTLTDTEVVLLYLLLCALDAT